MQHVLLRCLEVSVNPSDAIFSSATETRDSAREARSSAGEVEVSCLRQTLKSISPIFKCQKGNKNIELRVLQD
jgi:hypothetical protein